jgi:hypothetical protein
LALDAAVVAGRGFRFDFDRGQKEKEKVVGFLGRPSGVMPLRPLGLPSDVLKFNAFWSRRAPRLKYAALRCKTDKRLSESCDYV